MVYENKDEFCQLSDSNLDYVREHRWPPLSYETAMEEYRKKYLDTEEDEAEKGGSGFVPTSKKVF